MEECKNSVAMDCQAVDTPHQEAGIKRPPPSKPLMKPEDKRPTPAIPHNRTEEAANALTPLSLAPPVDDPLAALQLKMDQLVQGYLYLSENNQRLEKTVSELTARVLALQSQPSSSTVCPPSAAIPPVPTNPPVRTTPPVPSASKETVRGASSSATTNAEWTIARHRRSKAAHEKTAPTTTPATHQPITYAQAAHPTTVVRPPCPSVQLRASLLAQDPASRVQALLSVPRPPRPATQVSSLVVSLHLKRSAWQDKIFSVKVLIEALTGQRIIDANILSPTLFEIFLPADQRDAMATILRQGGHLHEMPPALTVKDIKRRAATYNRSHDDLMRAATLQGFSPALQHQLLQSALQSLPRIPVTRQALVHQAITKDLAILDL